MSLRSSREIRRGIAACLILLSLDAPLVPAAEPAESTQPTDADEALAEIVVTAQHRSERAQDVPISVQVLDGAMLAESNINSLNDVTQIAPSIEVSTSGRSNALYLRGVGSGASQSFDQSVGIFIDGVYHGRSRVTGATFLDLERIEVLKGPQSIYFGNNAIAGALSLATKLPGEDFDASVRLLASPTNDTNGGQYAAEGAIGVPITDKLRMRAAASYSGQDGWMENVNTGRRTPEEDNRAGRLTFLFAPTDNLDVILKAEASDNRNDGGIFLQSVGCPPPAPFVRGALCNSIVNTGAPTGLDDERYSQSNGAGIDVNTQDYALTANYNAAGHTFTSITGYYRYEFNLDLDADGTALPFIHVSAPEEYRQFSQELRVASALGGPLEYVAGAYFQDGDLDFTTYTASLLNQPTPRPVSAIHAEQTEQTSLVFGALTWNATDRLSLTGGVRASRVEKTLDWASFSGVTTLGNFGPFTAPAGNAVAPLSFERSEDAIMPSGRVQYRFADAIMGYASYSRGFKAGGFIGSETSGNPARYSFEPEHVNGYEIGLKSEWLGRRLLLNLAAFQSDYSDLQVTINQFDGTNFINLVRNAAQSRSRGIELETRWRASKSLRLGAEVTYLDSRFTDYPNAGLTLEQTFALSQCVAANPSPSSACDPLRVQDLSGARTPFSPRWSGTVTGEHTASFADDLQLTSLVMASFRSDYNPFQGNDPLHAQDGYVRLDARLTLHAGSGRWAFDLLGNNLTDRTIVRFTANQPTAAGSLLMQKDQPRNFAAQVRYRW